MLRLCACGDRMAAAAQRPLSVPSSALVISPNTEYSSWSPFTKVCLHCAGDRFAGVAVSAMFCFIAFFSCGAGPLPFVIMSEMVGGFHIKAKVASVCTALNW